MGTAGSGSALSLVRSMKKARDDPQAREKTDTMTPTIIVGGKLPAISEKSNFLSRRFIRGKLQEKSGCHLIQH